MKNIHLSRALFGATLLWCAAPLAGRAASVRLDEMDLSGMSSGWGYSQKNKSITQRPMSIGGVKFEHGVGTHAYSEYSVKLDGKARAFAAKVGVDDDAGSDRAAVEFVVMGDGRMLWDSGVCKFKDAPKDCRISIAGVKVLTLCVANAANEINFDHGDWADATFECQGAPPAPFTAQEAQQAAILTPLPSPAPHINGPKAYGVRPGSPFLYRIPCTGARPISFSATGLPGGLALDAMTGVVTGAIRESGTYAITFTARNAKGQSERPFRIVVGGQLALTPPMGWNSWYIYYSRVSDQAMRQAADQMIASGMADFGYQYVNSDDCWPKKKGNPPYRDARGNVLPNAKFPDMKGLTGYIHAKGLKAGIYISPGPWTCGGYTGSYKHEAGDARQFAAWGFDFLKYDWCSYGTVSGPGTLANYKKPYALMWGELQKQNRDIVFNLCQYGMGGVWTWGSEVGNSWRTTGDLGLERGSALPGFYQIGFQNAEHWQYAHPGAWNDPDYILIGHVGDAWGEGPGKPTTLTPDEQYSYMSMWSLMASPLIFSGDMSKLDPFTLNILCNSEVIDVDQDTLGKQARILRHTDTEFVLVKDLEDGAKAVGLFNIGATPATLSISWADLGIAGRQQVRNLWPQKSLGAVEGSYKTLVPRHGVAFIRLMPVQK